MVKVQSNARPDRGETPRGHGPSWAAPIVLVLAVGLLVLGAARWWPRTVDDAFITFRYSENLADGSGPVFNPGERVEGYSNPSWMLMMAGAIGLGADPVPVAKWLGLLAAIACVLLVYADLRHLDPSGWAAGAGAALLGSSLVLQIWSVAGMETTVYALFFLAGMVVLGREESSTRAVVGASLCLVAAALTRPEGLAFWVLGALVVASERTDGKLRRLGSYAAPGLLLLLHLAWRIAYYGVPLPNTYYAKTGGGSAMWSQGLHGLGLFVSNPAHVLWLAAAIAGVTACLVAGLHRRRVIVLGGAVLLHLLYVISVGDDGLRVHRFYVPVLGPLAVLAGLTLVGERGSRRRRLWWFGLLATTFTVIASMWTFHVRMVPAMHGASLAYQQGNVKLGRFLARQGDPEMLVAVPSAGAIPYYSGVPTIDMYGLSDAHIARVPFPQGGRGRLMKWDNDYVLARAPEWIVINRGYFAAGDPDLDRVPGDPGILAVSPMDRDLFARVARDGRYALGPVRFDDGSVFFVFVRSDGPEIERP
jgi:arabinofuranosyltransferase